MIESKWAQISFIFFGCCFVWFFLTPVELISIGELIGAGMVFTITGLLFSTVLAIGRQIITKNYLWQKWHVWGAAPVAIVLMVFAHTGLKYEESTSASKNESILSQIRDQVEQEDPDVQFRRGYNYAVGDGVPQDDAQAVKWYRKAAEQGYAAAQYNLGVIYYNGLRRPAGLYSGA